MNLVKQNSNNRVIWSKLPVTKEFTDEYIQKRLLKIRYGDTEENDFDYTIWLKILTFHPNLRRLCVAIDYLGIKETASIMGCRPSNLRHKLI